MTVIPVTGFVIYVWLTWLGFRFTRQVGDRFAEVLGDKSLRFKVSLQFLVGGWCVGLISLSEQSGREVMRVIARGLESTPEERRSLLIVADQFKW